LLADMPFGMGRGPTSAAGEVGCGQARFHLPSLAVTLKLSTAPSCLLGFFQMSGTVKQPHRAVALRCAERNYIPGQMSRLSSGYDA
jgi:hypothetical protein